jgi:hypothetical protein
MDQCDKGAMERTVGVIAACVKGISSCTMYMMTHRTACDVVESSQSDASVV